MIENFREINDSYFQMVSKFSEMGIATALKTHAIATMIMGITGLITIHTDYGVDIIVKKGY